MKIDSEQASISESLAISQNTYAPLKEKMKFLDKMYREIGKATENIVNIHHSMEGLEAPL
jgi:hypothetical protein